MLRRNIILELLRNLRFYLFFLILFVAQHNGSAAAGSELRPLDAVEIAPGVFVAEGKVALADEGNRGHIANLSFVIGEKAVAVIDTGGSFLVGRRLLAAIRAKTDLPVSYVINTHAHPDHMFGNGAFAGPGVSIIGHANFNTAMAQRGPHYLAANLELIGREGFSGTGLVPADASVADRRRIDLGGRVLELVAVPTAHTDNDLIVVDEETDTAFLGDLLFMRHVPALDGSLRGWLSLMDELSERSFARVVPGHGPASADWPEALRPQRRYLARLARDLRASIAKGASISEATANAALDERRLWALFDEFNVRNATAGFAELEWE